MNDRSPLRRFITVSRDFGLAVAMRVAYSKVRGRLCPALALPDAPAYNAKHREVSVLLSTAGQGAATLDAVAEVVAARDWTLRSAFASALRWNRRWRARLRACAERSRGFAS